MFLVPLLAVVTVVPDSLITARLDRLLELHKEYGLPLPPREARPVWFFSYTDHIGHPAGLAQKRVYAPALGFGFSLDGRTILGNFNEAAQVDSIYVKKPDPTTLHGNTDLADLTLAVQCHARGLKSLARATYLEWRHRFLEPSKIEWKTDEEYLTHVAYAHWRYRLYHDPDSKLQVVVKQMKRLMPAVVTEVRFPEDRQLLQSLERSLEAPKAKPGSDDALIDALIEICGDIDGERQIKVPRTCLHFESAFRTDPRYRALVRGDLRPSRH